MIQSQEIELKKLTPNKGQIEGVPTNPRKHTKESVERMKKSIEETPLMLEVNEMTAYDNNGELVVIRGNLRFKALKALGRKTALVKVLPAETPKETVNQIVIKDNTHYGEWDNDLLANEWDKDLLEDWGVSIDWGGEENTTETKEAQEDDFSDEEAQQAPAIVKRGEIYQLGEHRLMCGDSTDAEQVKMLMGGVLADMVFTDPPYGIDYSGGRTQVVGKKEYGKLKNDDLQGVELGNLICNVFKHNKKGADVYVCVSPIMQKPFLDIIEKQNKDINAVIVWDKKAPGLGYMAYRRQCEFILFVKGGEFHKGDKSDVDIWRIGRDDATTYVHGTQKPIGVSGRAIQNSSKKGDVILDYFGGSGSTMMACEQLERKCYMMELDEHYCDVIIARWEKLTGKKAEKIN